MEVFNHQYHKSKRKTKQKKYIQGFKKWNLMEIDKRAKANAFLVNQNISML